jgi:hypothetical protein
MRRRQHHHGARLAEFERTLDIDGYEAAFEADCVGRVRVDDGDQFFIDCREPGGTAQDAGADGSGYNVTELAAAIDYPKPGDRITRIHAKYPHSNTSTATAR